MGNVIYLSSKHRAIKSDEVTATLKDIATKYFRGTLNVEVGTEGWKLEPLGTPMGRSASRPSSPGQFRLSSFDLWRDSQRKLSCKHTHGVWEPWVQALTLDLLALRLNLQISDEGVSDPPWNITRKHVDRIKTFLHWFEMMYQLTFELDPARAEGIWQEYLRYRIPQEWRFELTVIGAQRSKV